MLTPGRLVYLVRRRLALGWGHWFAENFLERRIFGWKPDPGTALAPVPVHLLASRHDWKMALWMLASLHHSTGLRWKVTLHEDGSLGREQFDVFHSLFEDVTIIRRQEADAAMDHRLSRHPRCAEYRRRMPHGLKAFDIPQLAVAERYLMLDPDVLFFRKPEALLKWVHDPEDRSCWFNRDFQEPSPIQPARAESELGIKLWPQVNSGLCFVTRELVSDLDAMETWLDHAALKDPEVQWRVEQTLLALSASKAGSGGLLPSGYEVSPGKHRRPGCVARHYVGCVRDRFLSEGMNALRGLVA